MKTQKGRNPTKSKSFWETAPGMLTAVAALITALGGCVAIIVSNPRLLDIVLPPPVTPSPAYVTASTLPAAGPQTALPSVSSLTTQPSQPVQLPDGSTVMIIDQTGNKYQYTISSAQLEPMPPNQDLLHLQVRMWTNYPYSVNFWSDSFRLYIGDQHLKSSNFLDELVARDETKDGVVEFEVDTSIKDAVLVITVPLDFPENTKQLRLIFP